MVRLFQALTPIFSLLCATAIWLPVLHLFFRPPLADFRRPNAIAPEAQRLAARHLALWEDPSRREQEIARMRASNAEWDFMGRTYDGKPNDGPEGSSIWMVAHCLEVVDPDFAAEQYRLARQQIGKEVLGFGYAREWPPTWEGIPDVDSGPIVPILNASAGSSGLAVLGAATFHDDGYLQQLLTTLNFAGFPTTRAGELRFAASNQVGDAVLLYAMVQGPLWDRVAARTEKRQ